MSLDNFINLIIKKTKYNKPTDFIQFTQPIHTVWIFIYICIL